MKTFNEIFTHIAETIESISLSSIKAADIDPNDRILVDLGLDSLDYATVLLDCEKWLGITIQEAGVNWGEVSTVANLATFLENEQRRWFSNV